MKVINVNENIFNKSGVTTKLEWKNLTLTIKNKKILNKNSGCICSGNLTGILGPSGSGKSSLLNVLSGRIGFNNNIKIEGDILINGKKIDPLNFRQNIAYVMQEDTLYPTSTPKESIEMAAILKNENDCDSNKIIDTLELTKCQNTIIGSKLIKGISGGEKKRTSIGVEMVSEPKIIFLDEPTSGLDVYSAWKVIKTLKKLSESGRLVLASIHQPSSEIFDLFDNVIFLDNGNMVYSGIVKNIVPHFDSIGYKCPDNYNPADYLLFILQTTKDKTELYKWENNTYLNDQLDEYKIENNKRSGSFCLEISYLTKRSLKNIYRDKKQIIVRLIVVIFLNTLYSLIFLNRGNINKSDYNLEGHFGSIANLAISAMFSAVQPIILTFPIERPVFLREYSSGLYGAIPYVLSKTIIEMSLNLFFTIVMLLLTFWSIDFNGNFFMLVVIFWLQSTVGSSLALLLGSVSSNVQSAVQMTPLLLVPQILFSGIFLRLELIPSWLRWIQYTCFLKYTINLISLEEFDNINVPGQKELFKSLDIEKNLTGFYIGILLGFFFFYRILSTYFLIKRAKDIQ